MAGNGMDGFSPVQVGAYLGQRTIETISDRAFYHADLTGVAGSGIRIVRVTRALLVVGGLLIVQGAAQAQVVKGIYIVDGSTQRRITGLGFAPDAVADAADKL
jgi:hypothetical protein